MLFFWIFFQLLGFLGAYHWDGNTMYDLEYQGSSFDSEAASWLQSSYFTPGVNVKTSNCDGNRIIGGFQILGGTIDEYWERTYSSLPTHNVIKLSIRIYPIDSWDSVDDDHFELAFDGVKIIGWTLQGNDVLTPTNVCGRPDFKDLKPLLMSVTFPHTAGSLVFRVINSLNDTSYDESLGFRDVKMEFQQVSNPPTSFSFCGVTQGFPLDYNACPCADGQYMTPVKSGLCMNCDSTCLTCSAAGSSACVTCPDGRYKVGTTCPQCNLNCQTCSGSATTCQTCPDGQYKVWNTCLQCNLNCQTCSGSATICQTCPTGWFMVGTTCYPTCDSPLYPEVVNGVTYCRTPCPGSIVWWDGSCSSVCSYSNSYGSYQLIPVTINTFSQCNYPCPTSQYLYWNASCIGSCPSPLTNQIFKVRNFCGYSCLTTQYLYWNGSCLPNCPWPLSPETQNAGVASQKNFCWYYCQPGEFMYWNGSCISTCPLPLTTEVQGTPPRQFCWYTCSTTQYLYWNGSCLDACPWPLSPEVQGTIIAYKRNFCWYYCQPGEFMYWNGSCISTCPLPLTTEVQGTNLPRQFCWYRYGCAPTQYLYWNGSCFNNCPWPLSPEVQGTITAYKRNFCWYYCQPGEFMYWNGSCLSTCPLPLTTEVQGTPPRQFCWYTCSTTQYLYWNGSCLDACPWPLSPEVQGTIIAYKRNFCWYSCQPGEFMYWNGSCLSTCPWPLVSEVQGTNLPRQFCWYTCQPSEYLYWNGSCLGTCPSPLTPETQQGTSSNRKFCWYGCAETQHLYWNGSCIDKCDSPLDSEVQGIYQSRNFCWSPCQGGQYIYWNRSCLSECPSPLAKKIDPDVMFCQNPCADPIYYLFSNQSCLSTCPSPLSVLNNPGAQYCVNLCPGGTYLYENQTCLSVCSSPYLKRTEPVDIEYCDRPCSQPNIYWYQNASCLPECRFPYVKFNYSGILQCLPPCEKDSEYFYDYEKKCYGKCESPYKIELVDVIKVCKVGVAISVEEVEKIQETVASIKTQGTVTSGGMKAASAINSNSPASALLAGLSSMMQYIRYMKINYPPKVQTLFLVSAGSPISMSFGVNMPSFIEKNLIDEPLPEAFDKYDINSNFVSNLWDFMVSLVLILMAILVLAILRMITFGLPKLNAVVTRVLQVLKWNFPLMMICGSSGDIFFFASLQLRSSPFQSLASTICCVISILMMILVILLLGIAFKIVSVMHRRLQNQQQEAEQWKGFEILYTEYEEKSFFSLAYMFLFVSRGIIFNLTLAILYDYPIVQCIIINICNIAMICYVLYLRPLKELLALVQLWINEGLVNILSISVLILGILDKMGVDREATRVGVGNVILFVIKTFNTAGLVFMGIGMLLLVISICRTLKILREKNIKSPVQMLKALIFGVPEPEKVNPVGKEEFAKKPRIVKPLRKEKIWTREENSSVIEMKEDKSLTHLVSDNSNQILPTHILQTEFKDELQVSDLDISQSFFNPQKKISRGNGSLMRVCKVRVQGRKEILESSKEQGKGLEKISDEDEMKLWYSKLRKLKRRLNKSSKKIDLTIETNHSSSL